MAMTQTDFYSWQAYCEMRDGRIHCPPAPTPEELQENLEEDRRQRRINTTRHLPTPFEKYELAIAEKAAADCKTPAEWRKAEAEDIRHLATGIMTQKSASELLERYRYKLQGVYRTENWYEKQIGDCDLHIAELKKLVAELIPTNKKRTLRGAKNKLKHWQARRAGLQCNAMRFIGKERRYEQKSMKYTGVMEKIKEADIKREIKDEQRGIGNKYGYNPKAQDRETAEIVFHD